MKRLLILLSLVGATCFCQAQDDFEEFRRSIRKDFKDFRQKNLEEYTDFLRDPWKDIKADEPVLPPQEKPVPPVVAPQDAPVKSQPVVIDGVVKPAPVLPQPQPVSPIRENDEETRPLTFEFFGTRASVRLPARLSLSVTQLDENALADVFASLTGAAYDNLLHDCMALRKKLSLCDWAYVQMLKSMAEAACGKDTNEAELLLAYVFMQSGYKMRLAHDGHRLHMLYACDHHQFSKPFYLLDGERYYGLGDLPYNLKVSAAKFPKEQRLSLLIPQLPKLDMQESPVREVQSKKYSDVRETVRSNKNLIAFFGTYPSSYYGDEIMSQWSQYAEVPLSTENAWDGLKRAVSGLSEYDAVNRLLNWVQTGFEYEYDSKVWGGDRIFFADETLYYPYCDCEDRSILLTRLVRDLLHLDCLLVYYPGHLAAAVKFSEPVEGDYIAYGGKKFVVCDPTYIGARVGQTMPQMDNRSAKVVVLRGK